MRLLFRISNQGRIFCFLFSEADRQSISHSQRVSKKQLQEYETGSEASCLIFHFIETLLGLIIVKPLTPVHATSLFIDNKCRHNP